MRVGEGEKDGAGNAPFAVVLGIAQDGGVPQAGCRNHRWCRDRSVALHAASLGVVDPRSGRRWIIEATPDFRRQLAMLDGLTPPPGATGVNGDLSGIFLTHAHMGHYTGLIHLGPEAICAAALPVHVMPRLARFLESNEPWRTLTVADFIRLEPLADGSPVLIGERLSITPFLIPHREDHSETVGFEIRGPNRAVMFVPDVDSWDWATAGTPSVEERIASVDMALLDGSFFGPGELPGRDLATIPHPTIQSSMKRFGPLPESERAKIHFFHLNHSNPAIDEMGPERAKILEEGFAVARELDRIEL